MSIFTDAYNKAKDTIENVLHPNKNQVGESYSLSNPSAGLTTSQLTPTTQKVSNLDSPSLQQVKELQKLVPPQSNTINSNSHSGVGVVEPSSTAQQYTEFLQNKNPITGTTEYLAEKAKGFISVKSNNYFQPGTEFVQVAEALPYFIPTTSAPYALAAGAGQFATSGGQAELKKAFEQGTGQGLLLTSGSAIGVVGGAVGTLSKINEIRGLPKTQITSSTRNINQIATDSGTIIESNTVAEAKQIKTLIDDTYFNALQTKTEITPLTDGLQQFKSVTRGVSREYKGTNFINEVYGEPKPFVGVAKGIIKNDEVIFVSNGIESKPFNVNSLLFEGKVQGGKQVDANFLDDLTLSGSKLQGINEPSKFAGGGMSILGDEMAVTFAKFKPLKEGRLVKNNEFSVFDISKNVKSSFEDSNLIISNLVAKKPPINPTALTKVVEEAVITNIIYKNPTRNARAVTQGLFIDALIDSTTKQENKVISSQAVVEKDIQTSFSGQGMDINNILNEGEKTIPKTSQRSSDSLASGSTEALAEAEKQVTKSMSQTLNQMTSTSLPVGFFGLKLPFYDLKSNKESSKRKRLNPAYLLQVKRRGKFQNVQGGLTRGKALELGENILRNELARSARIVPRGETSDSDIGFNISPEFRQYNIKKGQKIFNPDVLIQKRRFSLGSQGERQEIRRARVQKYGNGLKKAMQGLLN